MDITGCFSGSLYLLIFFKEIHGILFDTNVCTHQIFLKISLFHFTVSFDSNAFWNLSELSLFCPAQWKSCSEFWWNVYLPAPSCFENFSSFLFPCQFKFCALLFHWVSSWGTRHVCPHFVQVVRPSLPQRRRCKTWLFPGFGDFFEYNGLSPCFAYHCVFILWLFQFYSYQMGEVDFFFSCHWGL